MIKNFFSDRFRFIVKGENAFSLMEAMLAVALTVAVGVALFHTFSQGLNIWERAAMTSQEDDIALFLDKLNEELTNTVNYSKLKFEGNNERVTFPSIVKTAVDVRKNPSQDYYTHEIGTIEYYFDKTKKNLYRSQANFGQAIMKKKPASRVVITGLDNLTFKYLYFESGAIDLLNRTTDFIPSSLVVSFEIKLGTKMHKMSRIVKIPVGT